jgi:hypothetical protein
MFLDFYAGKNKGKFMLTTFQIAHNHEVSNKFYQYYPQVRRLDEEKMAAYNQYKTGGKIAFIVILIKHRIEMVECR